MMADTLLSHTRINTEALMVLSSSKRGDGFKDEYEYLLAVNARYGKV